MYHHKYIIENKLCWHRNQVQTLELLVYSLRDFTKSLSLNLGCECTWWHKNSLLNICQLKHFFFCVTHWKSLKTDAHIQQHIRKIIPKYLWVIDKQLIFGDIKHWTGTKKNIWPIRCTYSVPYTMWTFIQYSVSFHHFSIILNELMLKLVLESIQKRCCKMNSYLFPLSTLFVFDKTFLVEWKSGRRGPIKKRLIESM